MTVPDHVQSTTAVGRAGSGTGVGWAPVGAPRTPPGVGGAVSRSRTSAGRSAGQSALSGATKVRPTPGAAGGGALPSQRTVAPAARTASPAPSASDQDVKPGWFTAVRNRFGLPQGWVVPRPSFVRPEATSRFIGIVCIVTFVAALVMTLFVNIWLARGAYQLKALQTESAILAETEQIRSEELSAFTAPAALCQSARDLGMGPATSVKFIRLQDGQVLGGEGDARTAATPGAGVCAPTVTADVDETKNSKDQDSSDRDQ